VTAPFAFGARGVSTLWAVLAFVINTFRPRANAAAPRGTWVRASEGCDVVSMIASCLFPPDLFDPPGQRLRVAVWSP
jgi:hypothetical protein